MEHFAGIYTFMCYATNLAKFAIVGRTCSVPIVKQPYFGCFHTDLKYAIIHWSNASNDHRIFILQKKANRIISKLKK